MTSWDSEKTLNSTKKTKDLETNITTMFDWVKMHTQFEKTFLHFCWILSGADVCKTCRSRRILENACLISIHAEIGFDTVEGEPFKLVTSLIPAPLSRPHRGHKYSAGNCSSRTCRRRSFRTRSAHLTQVGRRTSFRIGSRTQDVQFVPANKWHLQCSQRRCMNGNESNALPKPSFHQMSLRFLRTSLFEDETSPETAVLENRYEGEPYCSLERNYRQQLVA